MLFFQIILLSAFILVRKRVETVRGRSAGVIRPSVLRDTNARRLGIYLREESGVAAWETYHGRSLFIHGPFPRTFVFGAFYHECRFAT